MQLRLPWILSRKRLLFAAGLDGTLFCLIYHILFYWRFQRFPSFSLPLALLLAIWLFGSYITGRYLYSNTIKYIPPLVCLFRQISSTAIVLALFLGLTIFRLWLSDRHPVDTTFYSFPISFLFSFSFLSSALQFFLALLSINQVKAVSNVWSFVGSTFTYNRLVQQLHWTRLNVSLIDALSSPFKDLTQQQIVVQSIYVQDPQILKYLLLCQRQGATVLSLISWCEIVLQRIPPTLLSDADLIDSGFAMPKSSFQSRFKRAADVVVSVILLIITSPLLLAASLLIKLSDGGPVFYSQLRNGYGGRPFRIWKLRTMNVDAEQFGVQWSSPSDIRVTTIGSILRRTRVDELPQLIVVLTGKMSLIGPRPERPEFDVKLGQDIPYYGLRHIMRPGLSGWAQVNYPYGASIEDAENKLSYDIYYLRNFSIWLDLLIFFKTIRLVMNAQGSLPSSSM